MEKTINLMFDHVHDDKSFWFIGNMISMMWNIQWNVGLNKVFNKYKNRLIILYKTCKPFHDL